MKHLTLLIALLVASPALANEPRFTPSVSEGDVVLADAITGLEWTSVAAEDGAPITWQAALQACDASTFGGFEDWRLPDVLELSSLVDDAKASAPAINTAAFPGAHPVVYWTATTYAPGPTQAFVVHFLDSGDPTGLGGVARQAKTATGAALCVRDPV